MIVLIPAYEPDLKMIGLIERLRADAPDVDVVIVDDGSGPDYAALFAQARAMGCTVVGHPVNKGKGYALKAGFRLIEERFPGRSVVCADCDGQHLLDDIVNVGRAAAATDDTMVLGARHFTGKVPVKSRIGNAITRVLFARSTGHRLIDTQTGLRAYPAAMLPWLRRVSGDRFEYELEVLLRAERDGMRIREVPIDTVYLDGNASSHFRPLVDSVRVYRPLAAFSLSSLVAFGVDLGAVLGLHAATGNLLASVIGARLVSATINFTTNRRLVFAGGRHRSLRSGAARYASLVGVVLTANYALMHLLHERIGLGLLGAKLLTEASLFVASYQAQKRVVFAGGTRGDAGPAPCAAPYSTGDPAAAVDHPDLGRADAVGVRRLRSVL